MGSASNPDISILVNAATLENDLWKLTYVGGGTYVTVDNNGVPTISVPFKGDMWVGITVNAEWLGGDLTLVPDPSDSSKPKLDWQWTDLSGSPQTDQPACITEVVFPDPGNYTTMSMHDKWDRAATYEFFLYLTDGTNEHRSKDPHIVDKGSLL